MTQSNNTSQQNDNSVDLENMSVDTQILCERNSEGKFIYPSAPVVADTLTEAYAIANQKLQSKNRENRQLTDLEFQECIKQYSNTQAFASESTLCEELSKKYAILTGEGNDKEYEYHSESWWKQKLAEHGNDIKNFPYLIYPITGETADKNIVSDGMFLTDVIYENPLLRCQYTFANENSSERESEFFSNILIAELSRRQRQIQRVELQRTYENVLNATSPKEKEYIIKVLNTDIDKYIRMNAPDSDASTSSSPNEQMNNMAQVTDLNGTRRKSLQEQMNYMTQVTNLNEARSMTRRLARTRKAINDNMPYSGGSDKEIQKLTQIQAQSRKRNIFSRALSSTSTGIVNVINYPGKKLNDSLNKSFKRSPRARDFFRAFTSWMVFGGSGGNEVKGRGWGFSMFLVKAISAIAIPATLFGLSIAFPPLAFPLFVAAMSFSALGLVQMFRNIFSNIKALVDKNNSTNVDLTSQIKKLQENLQTVREANKINIESEEKQGSKMDVDGYLLPDVDVEPLYDFNDIAEGEWFTITMTDNAKYIVFKANEEHALQGDITESGIIMRKSQENDPTPPRLNRMIKPSDDDLAKIGKIYNEHMIETQEIEDPKSFRDRLEALMSQPENKISLN